MVFLTFARLSCSNDPYFESICAIRSLPLFFRSLMLPLSVNYYKTCSF